MNDLFMILSKHLEISNTRLAVLVELQIEQLPSSGLTKTQVRARIDKLFLAQSRKIKREIHKLISDSSIGDKLNEPSLN